MLYDKIKQVAAEKGVCICWIEDNVKIARGSISKWNKVRPSYNKVAAVAKYLGISIEELMNE